MDCLCKHWEQIRGMNMPSKYQNIKHGLFQISSHYWVKMCKMLALDHHSFLQPLLTRDPCFQSATATVEGSWSNYQGEKKTKQLHWQLKLPLERSTPICIRSWTCTGHLIDQNISYSIVYLFNNRDVDVIFSWGYVHNLIHNCWSLKKANYKIFRLSFCNWCKDADFYACWK